MSPVKLRCASSNALELLKVITKRKTLRPQYFWPLFNRMFAENGEAPADSQTISLFVLPKIRTTLKDCRTSIKILNNHGVTMAVVTALYNLLFKRRFVDAQQIVQTYSTKLEATN